ncbi:MAG: adenylate/guanylate cyclase domain-containing protein [Armatimonadetes bacterium]|nr:adenylate/guanylate cyclase domain-containing protein [Armatimonadota bacterium]
MVIFGAPQTSDSHALQAVRAAVEMQMELDRLREQWILEGKPCFEMGVGICTGSISLGMVGGAVRKQYTAIGDVANTAARLQGLSVELSSPVLVAESTYKEIINEVWAAPLRKVSLKGKKQSVMVYRINGLKDEERRMRVLKVEPDN